MNFILSRDLDLVTKTENVYTYIIFVYKPISNQWQSKDFFRERGRGGGRLRSG